jgi:hypothetical protein
MIKRISIILFVIFGLAGFSRLFATAQYPDNLVYKGKTYALFTNPLESYFEKYPDKRPKDGISSTALWRGYVATFEMRDNHLLINDIQIEVVKEDSETFEYEWKSVIHEVFPDSSQRKIDWFTGVLVLPQGKLVNYVHMGYGSTYKKYLLIEIANGIFKQELKFNHKQYSAFKKDQYALFKKTDEYKKAVEELKQQGNSDQEFIDSFLENFVIEYTSKILTDDE